MSLTHVDWTDWAKFYIHCQACHDNFPAQWNGFTGDEWSYQQKRDTFNFAFDEARTTSHCELCGCELTEGVVPQTFNPDPFPKSDSHLFEPEELTIPPIDFDKDSDVAIARWLLLQPRHLFGIPVWESLATCNAIHWVLYALEHPDESWDVEADKILLSKALTKAVDHLEGLNPNLKDFLMSYEKRHQSVFEKVKEILNDEPTE